VLALPWESRELGLGSETAVGPAGAENLAVRPGEPAAAIHMAFAAPDRATVDAFHEAGLQAGGRDNGAPGMRPHYHSGYYAA
jgi:hypothetical protein